jgi:type I site-specific restriction endonuclease
MMDIQMEREDDEDMMGLDDLEGLDITGQDDILDEAAGHIQANLEDELVQEALKKGQDLRQYSREIETELRRIENQSIKDYIDQSQSIASLHYQIKNCDDILSRMEGLLSKFQTDLGSISTEIQSLQDKSRSMSVKLQNRQGIKGELTLYLQNISVSEHLIQHITDTPASEREFSEILHELDEKLKFLNLQSFHEYRSVFDVHDVLVKLKLKAVSKIREFLLSKIYLFRRPMANYQMLQNQLLNYKYFNEFLLAHSRETASEIRTEYIDTLSKIYMSYFREYYNKIMKLQFEETPDKDDLMGIEDSIKRGGLFSSRNTYKNRSTTFTLGHRDTVLTTELEDPIIVIPQALKGEKRYPYETLFRSVHFALVDNSSREFLFVKEFFNLTLSACQEYFDAIFGKTLQFLLVSLSS